VASKCDLESQVDSDAAREFVEKESLDGFFEVSSKTGAGVTELVDALVAKLLEQESGRQAAGAAASASAGSHGTVNVVGQQTGSAASQKKCYI
jgi:hypothetical protein